MLIRLFEEISMESGNDNFSDESDFLLKKAKDIISKCSTATHEPTCHLMTGGVCPLLSSAITSFHSFAKKPL